MARTRVSGGFLDTTLLIDSFDIWGGFLKKMAFYTEHFRNMGK
jgi:hypothetical protein